MAAVQPGQIYESAPDRDRVVRRIRVLRVAPGRASGSAYVENVDGPKRARWIALDKLHTDGKQRRTGYNLKEEV